MARGWESKSVEEQQSMAENASPVQRSAAERLRSSGQRSLELQISRIEQQLQTASSDRHREMLKLGLAELQKRLQSL